MPSTACIRPSQHCPIPALMDNDVCREAGEGPQYYLACPHLSLIITRASTSRLTLRCVQETCEL